MMKYLKAKMTEEEREIMAFISPALYPTNEMTLSAALYTKREGMRRLLEYYGVIALLYCYSHIERRKS